MEFPNPLSYSLFYTPYEDENLRSSGSSTKFYVYFSYNISFFAKLIPEIDPESISGVKHSPYYLNNYIVINFGSFLPEKNIWRKIKE